MPYLPQTTTYVAPEEEVPPPQAAPPPQSAPVTAADYQPTPAPQQQAATPPPPPTGGVTAADYQPSTTPDPAAEPPPPAQEVTPGPFENAVKGAQSAIGNAVAPVAAQLPEPVRNVADAVGQPVGGAIDTVTNITRNLGQGNLPEAALAALEPAMAPSNRMQEEAGTRVADGQSAMPTPAEVIANPGAALAVLPAAVSEVMGEDVISDRGTQTIDEWGQQNPQAVQDAYDTGGGQAVVDAYLDAQSAPVTPPSQLSNPLDAGNIDAGPLERAGAILGAVPGSVEGWVQSGQEGTLGPFLKNQLAEAAMDPLTFVPPAIGERVAGSLGRAASKAIPGNLGELTPAEVARREAENISTAAGEYATALDAQRQAQAQAPIIPAGATATEVLPDPSLPTPGMQAAVPSPAAAPPVAAPSPSRLLDDVPPEMLPRVPGNPNGPLPTTQRVRTGSGMYEREVDVPLRTTPTEAPPARRVATPERVTPNGTATAPVTAAQVQRELRVGYGEAVRIADERNAARGTPIATRATPSPNAIGLRGSRWVNGRGNMIVAEAGTPRARIAPPFQRQVETVYREMFDAPAEQFWAPYQARFFDKDVPAADGGLYARYRGAMTQGLYMLDDWPEAKVRRRLPGAVRGSRPTRNLVENPDGSVSGTVYHGSLASNARTNIDINNEPGAMDATMGTRFAADPDEGLQYNRNAGQTTLYQTDVQLRNPLHLTPAEAMDFLATPGEIIARGHDGIAVHDPIGRGGGVNHVIIFGEIPVNSGTISPSGPINWERVEHLATTGDEVTRTAARKALGGKRAQDLYTHRIANAPDPDLEVRNLLLTYHLDQVSGRFDAERYTNTSYWRDRAAMLSEAIMGNYFPRPEALAALRAMDLAAEARLAFPDIPEARLQRLAGQSLVAPEFGVETLHVLTPRGERIPLSAMPSGTILDPASGVPESLPEPPATPAPTPTPPPADPVQAMQRMAQQQNAQAAYAAAPAEIQQAVAEVPDPVLTRYGVVTSEQAALDLAQPAQGRFRFADGYKPDPNLTVEDVFMQTVHDVEYWANVERMGNWPDTRSATMNREWQRLEERFNKDKTIDRTLLAGPANDLQRQRLRDQFALEQFNAAQQRALPRGTPPTRLGEINQAYMGFVRRNMLFNYLRIPSYVLQNQITNSINLGTRIGKGAVIDYWTSPAEWSRIFKYQKATSKGKRYSTFWGSLEAQMGMGHKPNIPQSHAAYLDRTSGKLARGFEVASQAIAPKTAQWIGTVPDQFAREAAATAVTMREFRKLNQQLVPKVRDELYARGVRVPEAKIRQVVRDFLDENRTVTDANTGSAYRTVLGRPAKHEAVWNPDAFGKYLKQRLTEDMRGQVDPGQFNRAIDRVTRDSKNAVRGILDKAEAATDHALFDWRNRNADEIAGKAFFFHYWMSRQGGLYVSEAIKHPWVLSSYGRMMEEFQEQADVYEQPPWMKGFFQMQNSVAGFSMWFSPIDLVQSLLTFADWQMGSEEQPYKDLTALGNIAGMAPFLIHPLLQLGAYVTGALGPDYYAPPVTGVETFGARAIDLLNLANAQGRLPEWVNAMGIGVDEAGNKVPLPVRPLQELYARVGNAISTALEPITGLSPVEVSNMAGSQERNIASILEQDVRKAHPEWDQVQVNRTVTSLLEDHGSDEYQAAFRKAAEMPFMGATNIAGIPMPGIVQGAARLASPVRVYNWPEQYNLDRWTIPDSGNLPPRTIPNLGEMDPITGELTPAGERAKATLNEAKYGATSTPEARRITEMRNDYYRIMPDEMWAANGLAGALSGVPYGTGPTVPVTVGGVEYTPEMLSGMSKGDLYDLGTQALADAGYTREDVQAVKDTQARFLADNPDYAAYAEYENLVKSHPGGAQGFVQETALTNPGFAQFVRSSLMNHVTGEIDYDAAKYPDAYLASQGVRPSVYSPVVGNEPSMTPGGYPSLTGGPSNQPLLPQVTPTADIPLYAKASDADGGYYDDPPLATIGPGTPLQVINSGAGYDNGMVQVAIGDFIGYVDAAYLSNASPAQPTAPMGNAPAPVQPTGGLAGLAGGVMQGIGSVVQGIGDALGGLGPHNSGEPTKPATTSAGTGETFLAPANDGYGVQSTPDSDRTWMELMVGNNNAIVTTDYKGATPGPWYAYQEGHGADSTTHAAYDISCDTGYRADGSSTCPGTPIHAPMAGRVVCAGYGQGTGEAIGSPACTYSQNTTIANPDGSPPAHTVVLDVGTDPDGNRVQLSFNHMGDSVLQPGQMVNPGDLLGGMGDTEGGPHIHLEGWIWSPALGTYMIVDPQLIVSGWYAQHGVDDAMVSQPAA